MNRTRSSLSRYLVILIGTVIVIGALCLAVNVAVDPLWYFRGNLVTGVNFPFNERLAKINRILPQVADVDCVILGSSTAALLPEGELTGYRCYNMGVSSGVVSESLMFARYLRARGLKPRLLVVGVDEFDFEGPTVPPDVPDFIKSGRDPPSFLYTYLSLDALDFSYRTLRFDYPHRRLYDREFRSHIIPRHRAYRAPSNLAAQADPPEFHPERADLYLELRHLFPEARAIAFVAPTAAWTIAQLELDGRLEAYLGALRRTASGFDEFLDFCLPSEITTSTRDTFDGLHYVDTVNNAVAAALVAGHGRFAVDWRREPFDQIAADYHDRIDRLVLHRQPPTQ
jgi:hypothetical protein